MNTISATTDLSGISSDLVERIKTVEKQLESANYSQQLGGGILLLSAIFSTKQLSEIDGFVRWHAALSQEAKVSAIKSIVSVVGETANNFIDAIYKLLGDELLPPILGCPFMQIATDFIVVDTCMPLGARVRGDQADADFVMIRFVTKFGVRISDIMTLQRDALEYLIGLSHGDRVIGMVARAMRQLDGEEQLLALRNTTPLALNAFESVKQAIFPLIYSVAQGSKNHDLDCCSN